MIARKIQNRLRGRKAFSLIEIALAVGIISFALVGILALFPVALNTTTESQQETQVALISRSIFAGLKATPAFLATKDVLENDESPTEIDLAEAKSYTCSFDEGGSVVGGGAPNKLSTGTAVYGAVLTIEPGTPAAGLSKATLSIRTPANAPQANQKLFEFVSLIPYSEAGGATP